jgi:nuclear pore complex protein Nup107
VTGGVEGNPFLSSWKRACYQLSNEAAMDGYERAIYAALCGNLESMLPVCSDWEDYLWAHFTALFHSRINDVSTLMYAMT